MRRTSFLCLLLLLLNITINTELKGQSRSDISFTALNTDGDDDFAIVALASIPSNTIFYFTDYEWDESASTFIESGSDGFLQWNTGNSIIKEGTIIVFTDIDNSINTNYGSSIGKLSSIENIGLLATGEVLFAYIGTDQNNPTNFITGIKNGTITTELIGTGLGGTDLRAGVDFLEFNPTTSPDGGVYSGSKSNQVNYSNYLSLLVNKDNWTRNTTDGEALLPFSQEAFTINTTTWNGSINNNWSLNGNWSNNLPTSSSNVIIPNVMLSPEINSGILSEVGNLTIDSGEKLTVNGAVIISGQLTINGNIDIISGGSIIVKGSSSGSITYYRELTDKWHLISSPVNTQEINDFVITESAINNIATNGTNYGLATYNNNKSMWDYYNTSTITSSGGFNSSKGYAVLKSNAGNISFKGDIPTTDKSINITNGAGNNWNLIGNPYPSFIAANINTNDTENFLSNNSSILHPAYQALYFWDGSNYYAVNQASDSRFISPGQGFFVNAAIGGGSIKFTNGMQNHQTIDMFSKTFKSTPTITILLKDKQTTKQTVIKYLKGCTTGLDPGFDAGLFSTKYNSTEIYTQLISNGNGIKFSLQALPIENYDNMLIPIGIDNKSNRRLSLSIKHSGLPENMMVFLEDRLTNTITRLNHSNDTYNFYQNSSILKTGRFYLRTATNNLTETFKTNDSNTIQIYATPEGTIKVTGLNSKKVRFKIYDVLGKEYIFKTYKTSPILEITTKLPTGMYIISLETDTKTIKKKIYLNNKE